MSDYDSQDMTIVSYREISSIMATHVFIGFPSQGMSYDMNSQKPCNETRCRPTISNFPVYQHVLALGWEGGIVLDLGCCCKVDSAIYLQYIDRRFSTVGTDVRKCWSDGIPAQNLIASDLRPGIVITLVMYAVSHSAQCFGIWAMSCSSPRPKPSLLRS